MSKTPVVAADYSRCTSTSKFYYGVFEERSGLSSNSVRTLTGRRDMMTAQEREQAMQSMDQAINRFYGAAVRIGNHPFIEFAGVMTAYLKSCRRAHDQGIDFTECNRHAANALPMEAVEVDYLVEKFECIFGGRITASA